MKESFKDKIYNLLVRKNVNVQYEYERYVMENIKEHYESHFKHWIILFKLKWHYQVKKSANRMLYFDDFVNSGKNADKQTKEEKILYYQNDFERDSVNKFVAALVDYDVISFDIFDTLIYRMVEKPNDIFIIMSAEMGMNDFADIRKKAENMARDIKERKEGNREIVLQDIYDVLAERFHVNERWMQREIELELNMSIRNEYIYRIYQMLLKFDKKIVLTTDMYLPLDVIKQMVEKNGYIHYIDIILSNEYGLRKGDGTLQKVLAERYPEQKIVHIGDNYKADVERSIEVGIDAIHNPDSHFIYREPELENLAASFYRAVIQTKMNNGLWDKNIYYSHGYRVGGILAVGYCNFINQIVRRKKIDKILFCARDCDILYKIYKEFYKETDIQYINISRYAVLNITSEHYLYDLANRYIMRYMKMCRSSKTIEMVLNEAGYGYLVNELEKYNIDRFQFPAAVDEKRIMEFLYQCSDLIVKENANARDAAKKYFSAAIGNSRNVLVVDIGWSGTCITALEYFVKTNLQNLTVNMHGALMCTNRNDLIKNSIQFDKIEAYINTPFTNMDITRYIFPGAPRSRNEIALDMLHMPFEYLFTSTEKSLSGYRLNANSDVEFEYSHNDIPNIEQIQDMQEGMRDFAEAYLEYSKECRVKFDVPPYTAFLPIREAISHERYAYEVYKDFSYDSMTALYGSDRVQSFGDLFGSRYEGNINATEDCLNGKRILFVSPEMTYSGTPRSLLRMCKVARELGYGITVWSAKDGPFIVDYEKENIKVEIISEDHILQKIEAIKEYDLAVCNTVMTDKYAAVCCQYIPTVWYIREATNIPDFIRNNAERAYRIKNSQDIYVVSDYAADALRLYADNPIHVAKNCVEDEADMATAYVPGMNKKVKFVQFGTMEYRKGYDVLLAAYKAMPESYQEKAELYFAGGFINSGTPFCSYLFREMDGMENVHYLGIVRGEENKIEILSGMDVVVVASRDESCSLVALEGAMLSKPLIVTENVGAKYMVTNNNGYVVKTGNVESLKEALMASIDNKENLARMGRASRKNYDEMAGMEAYRRSMKQLYSLSDIKNTEDLKKRTERNREIFSERTQKEYFQNQSADSLTTKDGIAVVSMTSHPGRIALAEKCIRTLIEQTVMPKKLLLWLSIEEFPNKSMDLPKGLIVLKNICDFFDIRWVEGDLKPHKKYFYAMQEYKDDPIIIVDDDVYYDSHLVENLLESYERFPDCVSAMRTNLIGFRRDGNIMDYEGWTMGYRVLQDTPSTQLIPTGVGGVLYPPGALPAEAFDVDAINENCLFCDDLWLKIWTCHAGLKTVMPAHFCTENLIEDSQDVALWKMNVRHGNNNDMSLKKILEHYEKKTGKTGELLRWIRKDRFC